MDMPCSTSSSLCLVAPAFGVVLHAGAGARYGLVQEPPPVERMGEYLRQDDALYRLVADAVFHDRVDRDLRQVCRRNGERNFVCLNDDWLRFTISSFPRKVLDKHEEHSLRHVSARLARASCWISYSECVGR